MVKVEVCSGVGSGGGAENAENETP